MSKKLISCLLAVMMLFTAAGSFAEFIQPINLDNELRKFLDETDMQTRDLALQVESGEASTDLVIRVDADNLHFVARENNEEKIHIQLNPTGIYVGSADNATLLRYSTVTTFIQNVIDELNAVLDEAMKSIPEEPAPTEAEIKAAVNELAILAKAAEEREQADAITLASAAMEFAGKFKPENILDVKEEDGSLQVSLRSEAYATAVAEAVDGLMSNPALAELVDRYAEDGDKTFAEAQKEWLVNRDTVLEAIRTMESTEKIDENGHLMSHFQIGEEGSAVKILVCDTDSWIDAEYGEAETRVNLGFKDEDPFAVYELSVSPSAWQEKLTSGNSYTDVRIDFADNAQIKNGQVVTVIEGNEQMRAEFGPNYLYMRGPKGGISTSIRETWTGKTRVELVSETAEGETGIVILDFYRDDDSLVFEVKGRDSKSEDAAIFRLSRIEKIAMDDLSASAKIDEITVEKINAVLETLLKQLAPQKTAEPETAK